MTMENAPSSSSTPESPALIDRVPTQAELEAEHGTKSENSIATRIDPDSLAALNAMFNTEPSGDTSDIGEAPAVETEPVTSEPEPARSRFARFLDKVSQGVATAADRQQERFEATQLFKTHRADQEAAYDTYAENIEATEQREARERAEARQEKLEAAKGAVRRFGRSALSLSRRAVIEAQAQYAVGKEVAANTNQVVLNSIEASRRKMIDGFDAVADTSRDAFKQTGESVKTFFAEKAAAALARKQARQAERARNREVDERLKKNRIDELRARKFASAVSSAAAVTTERLA